MDLRDYATPKTVVIILSTTSVATALGVFLGPSRYQGTIWSGFMDLVALLSLLLTVVILSELEDIQRRYLLRATIEDVQKNLKERANKLGEILRSGFENSEREIARELSKEDGILKQIRDRTESVDPDVHAAAANLREKIKEYTGSPGRSEEQVYDIWADTHTLNELVKGLIEESKWKR